MKILQTSPFEDIQQRTNVVRRKRLFGMAYGLTTGLAFSVATWGMDGYRLSQAHAFYPWLKFLVGALICGLVGVIAGWLVARFEKGIIALVVYLGVAFFFSWLVVALPLQIFPGLIARINPETGNLLNYTFYDDFNSRLVVAFGWVVIFVLLTGILQIPLAEPAAFTTSFFGKLAPMLVCTVIMVINGTTVDTFLNEPLRSALLAMDQTIQFSLDHRGQEVDQEVSRSMHLSSLNGVQEVVDQPRGLIVGSYDRWLGQINVLIRFGDTWVDCTTVYNQPSFCKYVAPNAP